MELRLECSAGPAAGRTVKLGEGVWSLGRGDDNAVVVDDPAVAPRHARLVVQPGGFLLTAEDNAECWLNGVRLEVPTQVVPDDVLRLGSTEWRLAADAEETLDETGPEPLPNADADQDDPDLPRLLVLTGAEQGRIFALRPGEPFVIGRGHRADLRLDDHYVSREHCTLFNHEGQVTLLDNDSANGVLVDGEKIRTRQLVGGEQIQIGRVQFRFQAAGAELAPPVPEPAPAEFRPAEAATPSTDPAGGRSERPVAPSSAPPIGKFGPFLLLAEIGRGGMGRVFSARLPGEEPVALKVMVTSGLEEERRERRRLRFEREMSVLQRIRHENVVAFRRSGTVDGRPFLAMELLRGPDLATELRRVGRLPAAEVERILFQLCAAVSAVHQAGIVHRDLKPSNVILHGPRRQVKLTDFGIARPLDEADIEGDDELLVAQPAPVITGAGRHPGTPLYMAPEQVEGDDLDMRSDIWALGVILYQLISGRRPFEGRTGFDVMAAVEFGCPEELPKDVPGYVQSAVYRCLLKPPSWRFASAIELMDALHERRIEQPVPVGSSGPEQRPILGCPHCEARFAQEHERCPICQGDLNLLTTGQMVQTELDGAWHLACGHCGHAVTVRDIACIRCHCKFRTRRSTSANIRDEELTELEEETLARGLARLNQCPHCGAAASRAQSRCGYCGIHLRGWLLGRVHLASATTDPDRLACGACGTILVDAAQQQCFECGLNFATGRLPDGRVWHADHTALDKNRPRR